MSFSYDRYDRRRQSSSRSTFGYWVPLIFTVTVATAGVVTWIWSERQDGDHEHDSDDSGLIYGEDNTHAIHPRPRAGYAEDTGEASEGFMARISGAIRRTPSPQQMFDNASRKLAAGVAAAGTAFGAALSSMREEDHEQFGDHSRWTEEAARRSVEARSSRSAAAVGRHTDSFNASLQPPIQPARPGTRMKRVVVVVSAASSSAFYDQTFYQEHISILSQLPQKRIRSVDLFVLIYAPAMKPRSSSSIHAASLASSYEAIFTPAPTSAEEQSFADPQLYASGPNTPRSANTTSMSVPVPESAVYSSISAQALPMVKNQDMIMPFATPSGHVHILRHLAPDLVYLTEDLAGVQGEHAEQIRNWVGQVMVVVGGGGIGLGLIDTEDEGHGEKDKEKKWWEATALVGLGKGVDVVDDAKVLEDFERRIGGKE